MQNLLPAWQKVSSLGKHALLASTVCFCSCSSYRAQANELKSAKVEPQEEKLIDAWLLVTNRAPGSTGKKDALELLFSAIEPDTDGYVNFTGINLSCNFMFGENDKGKCVAPPVLRKLDLGTGNGRKADFSEANLSGVDLREANLSQANFWGADLSGALLEDANLSRASLGEANLSTANLWRADLSDAYLEETNLSGALLAGSDLRGAQLYGVDLSGTLFCGLVECAKNATMKQLYRSWAWSDEPPQFTAFTGEKKLELAIGYLCDPSYRNGYRDAETKRERISFIARACRRNPEWKKLRDQKMRQE